MIHLKNKLLMAKTKVAVSSFWSKAIQVCGASLYDTVHDLCVHSVNLRISFCLPLTVFFMREQMSDKLTRIPSVVLLITSHDSLRVVDF